MIKFFKNIRKSNLKEGKAINYFKYAFGEIVLVVIGILIALQINNWNENRKTKEKEVKLLIELKDDLIKTKDDLLSDIEKSEQILSTTNELYKAITENEISETNPFKLSTSYILEMSLLFPKLSAYSAIQSEGITIISNAQLRKMITDFYQLRLKRVASAEAYSEELNNKELKPYLNTYSSFGSTCEDCDDLFELYADDQGVQQNIYLIPSVDGQLVHILKERFVVFRTLKQRYLELSKAIDDILTLIDQETNSKS